MKRVYGGRRMEANKKNNKYLVQIAKIWEDAFGDYGDDYYPKKIRDLVDFFIKKKYTFYILLKNDEVVASSMIDTINDTFGLTNICAKYKRNGDGTRLLNFIKLYHNEISLEVWNSDDIDDVLSFYIKNGFSLTNNISNKEDFGSHVSSYVNNVKILMWRK